MVVKDIKLSTSKSYIYIITTLRANEYPPARARLVVMLLSDGFPLISSGSFHSSSSHSSPRRIKPLWVCSNFEEIEGRRRRLKLALLFGAGVFLRKPAAVAIIAHDDDSSRSTIIALTPVQHHPASFLGPQIHDFDAGGSQHKQLVQRLLSRLEVGLKHAGSDHGEQEYQDDCCQCD